MYLAGEGVDRCSCTAREWLEKAAAQGISVAQRLLDEYLVNNNVFLKSSDCFIAPHSMIHSKFDGFFLHAVHTHVL